MTESTPEKPKQKQNAEEEDMEDLKKPAPKPKTQSPKKNEDEKSKKLDEKSAKDEEKPKKDEEKDKKEKPKDEEEKETPEEKMKKNANKFFNGKKHRRESSSSKIFIGDHMGAIESPEVDAILKSFTPNEGFYFADHCTRLTNRNHMEDCCILVSTHFVFILNNRLQHILTNGPIPISGILKIGTSQETDNAVVLYLPEYNSELIMTSFKIELMEILIERYKAITGNDIEVTFGNIIEFEVNEDTIFEFDFVRANDGVRMTLFIKAKPGIPRPR